jgi:hypothetical protein
MFKQGDHICVLYESEDEQLAVAAEYLAHGLRQGERCLYVADSREALDRFRVALAEAGIDAAAMVARGALLERTKAEAHLVDGRFDSERMLGLLDDAVEAALNDGFAGLRTCGDMSWLLDDVPGSEQVVEYEALLTQFFQNVRAVGMCQYDQRRLPAHLIAHGIDTHPLVVVDRRSGPNPFFGVSAPSTSAVDVGVTIARLRQR